MEAAVCQVEGWAQVVVAAVAVDYQGEVVMVLDAEVLEGMGGVVVEALGMGSVARADSLVDKV